MSVEKQSNDPYREREAENMIPRSRAVNLFLKLSAATPNR